MKKRIIMVLGFLLVLTLIWMGYLSLGRLSNKETIQNVQSDLSKVLNKLGQVETDITSSTILIYFNSECEHCQWEMQEISKSITKLKEYQLLLASFEPEIEAVAFLEQYDLSEFYIRSTPEKVMSAFSGGVPQTLIYQDGRLIKHFKGEVKIAAILSTLKK